MKKIITYMIIATTAALIVIGVGFYKVGKKIEEPINKIWTVVQEIEFNDDWWDKGFRFENGKVEADENWWMPIKNEDGHMMWNWWMPRMLEDDDTYTIELPNGNIIIEKEQ